MTNPQFLIHHDEDAEVYVNGILVLKVGGYTSGLRNRPADARGARRGSGGRTIAVHCRQTRVGGKSTSGLWISSPPSSAERRDRAMMALSGRA